MIRIRIYILISLFTYLLVKDTEICYLSKNYAKNDQNGQQSHRKCPCIFFSLFSSRTKNRDIFYIWNGCNFAGQSWHHPRIYAASLWEIINFVAEIVQGTISETEIPFILLLPLLTEQKVFLYPEVKVTSIAILCPMNASYWASPKFGEQIFWTIFKDFLINSDKLKL